MRVAGARQKNRGGARRLLLVAAAGGLPSSVKSEFSNETLSGIPVECVNHYEQKLAIATQGAQYVDVLPGLLKGGSDELKSLALVGNILKGLETAGGEVLPGYSRAIWSAVNQACVQRVGAKLSSKVASEFKVLVSHLQRRSPSHYLLADTLSPREMQGLLTLARILNDAEGSARDGERLRLPPLQTGLFPMPIRAEEYLSQLSKSWTSVNLEEWRELKKGWSEDASKLMSFESWTATLRPDLPAAQKYVSTQALFGDSLADHDLVQKSDAELNKFVSVMTGLVHSNIITEAVLTGVTEGINSLRTPPRLESRSPQPLVKYWHEHLLFNLGQHLFRHGRVGGLEDVAELERYMMPYESVAKKDFYVHRVLAAAKEFYDFRVDTKRILKTISSLAKDYYNKMGSPSSLAVFWLQSPDKILINRLPLPHTNWERALNSPFWVSGDTSRKVNYKIPEEVENPAEDEQEDPFAFYRNRQPKLDVWLQQPPPVTRQQSRAPAEWGMSADHQAMYRLIE